MKRSSLARKALVSVETANKILGLIAALLAIGATATVTWVLRWWVPQQSIRALRGEIEWHLKMIAQKDKELVDLRLQMATHEKRIRDLDQMQTRMITAERDRGSYLYGLEHYTRALEKICLECGRALPPRRDGDG